MLQQIKNNNAMQIISITPFRKNKSKVLVEENFAFVLYNSEIYKFGMKENEELPRASYEMIMTEILPKRAKERLFYLLKASDRTEGELRRKLQESCYPKEIIDLAINYMKNFNYINDERYAQHYIECHQQKKSKKCLEADLYKKGVSKDIIDLVLDHNIVEEELQIRRYIQKKGIDVSSCELKEKQKVLMALMRKGYSYEKIMKNLQ